MERPYYGFYHIINPDNNEIISTINLDDISYIVPLEVDHSAEGSGNNIKDGFNIHFKSNTTQFLTVNKDNYKKITEILSNS